MTMEVIMKGFRPTRFACVVLLFAVLLAADAPALQAQASFILSKNADFSTDDRVFARSDVLYMLVTAPQIDFTDLDKNEFRLKPDHGGNDIRGVFTNHFDGTYTASVPLDNTDLNESDWELRVRLEDDEDNEFEVRVDLQIGDDDQDDDDDDEDDDEDEDDEDDEVEFTGTVEALDVGSITVNGITFVVTEETIILDEDNNTIAFDDLAVGMTVEIRGEQDADGVLVATNIKIEDPPAAAGRIETMEENRLTVDAHSFLIDDDTRVLDARAAPISFSDLEVGLMVEVHARAAAAAAMPVAAQIKVMGEGDVAAALEENEIDVPVRFILGPNYPNPFNPETTISFELVQGASERVSLVIYTILGEVVRTLVQGELGPGSYQYAWDARTQRGDRVASGLYLYRLRVGAQVQTRSMVLLK